MAQRRVRFRFLAHAAVAAACACALGWADEAHAADEAPHAAAPDIADDKSQASQVVLVGSNSWGAQGGWRLDAARSEMERALSLAVSGRLSDAGDLFLQGDRDLFYATSVNLVWVPVYHLQLGLSGSFVVNRYTDVGALTRRVLGNPTFHAKYDLGISQAFRVGAAWSLTIPSAVKSATVAPRALTTELRLLGTWRALPWLEVIGNLGYVIDRSKLLIDAPAPDEARLVLGINDSNWGTWGVGTQASFLPAAAFGVVPFLEITGVVAQSGTGGNPILATLGAKMFPGQSGIVEIDIGADIRLTGTPHAGDTQAAAPPWQAMAQVVLHFVLPQLADPNHASEAWAIYQPAVLKCDTDADCTEGRVCIKNECSVLEVRHDVVTRQAQTFKLAGKVVDSVSGGPVRDALITLTGLDKSSLAVGHMTGAFLSWPLPCANGNIEMFVSAPGYETQYVSVAPGAPDTVRVLNLSLVANIAKSQMRLRGVVTDARTGKPIAAQIVVPAESISVDIPAGAFDIALKPGNHEVLVTAKGYVTQKKRVVGDEGDAVILNVDLVHARRHVGSPSP